MGKLSTKQIQGLLLIISAVLIWAPIPIPAKDTIAALIVVIIGVWLMIK